MALLTRRIWSFLSPNGYITKEDRMQIAVGYNRYPSGSIANATDTFLNVILGMFSLGGGDRHGIPNAIVEPYADIKKGYITLPSINIMGRKITPSVRVKYMNGLKISVELL
jgi:hypothetical protein